MSTLEYIILFTFLGSIGSLIGGVILLSKEKFALKISHFLASFAAGTLLGTAFLSLLPEAAHEAEHSGTNIFLWTLGGIIFFFLVERFIHWFHHHDEYHESETAHKKDSDSIIPLIIIGDTLHNFLDGIVIAATFMVNIPLGIATTIAIAMHEIPQEIGDFGLLLHKGLKRKTIIFINIFSAAAAFFGAIMTFMLGEVLEDYIAILLALTAGLFIYIASSDLIPEIHHEKRKNFAIIETLLLIIGIALIWFTTGIFAHGH
ncbi:MAG TPA: ZIP family metal transporter [Patescibacteria group bacterium]|nr:ZIP family metal transporter [Patescibacteria group bacterium]